MDLAGKTAQALARKSSRRQFFKFLGAGLGLAHEALTGRADESDCFGKEDAHCIP